MRIGIAVAVCALVFPAVAAAKGPTEGTISGPGLDKPLKLGGRNGWRQGSPMETLVRYGGFFQVAWGGQTGRTFANSPTQRLGPMYRVVYRVPGPTGADDRIRQELYPFAKGGPLTYTPAGQKFFRTRRTLGGWFRTVPQLTTALVAAGLPAQAQRTPSTANDRAGRPLGLWALVGTLALVVLAALALKRRARPVAA